ncbi:hypothetical protein [Streptomyces griseorubiginosus]|uniref:hypothetical protein n=1 Tax=Streptomyces griseorubiginosus TaxID=67304 RepID=UPI00113FE9A4|nr:hypothetical protein [Streptomyces griseorubiginosus]
MLGIGPAKAAAVLFPNPPLASKKRRQAGTLSVDAVEDFLALPLERQRALILHSLWAVLIHPAGRGRRKFDPSLIEPVWR